MSDPEQSAPPQTAAEAPEESAPRALQRAARYRARLGAERDGDTVDHCHDCAACLSRCHLAGVLPDMNPRKLLHLLRNGWEDRALADSFLWACTLCNRCTLDCPMGVRMEQVVRAARGLRCADGHAPGPLAGGIESRLAVGSVSGVDAEDYVEHAEWMEEELQMELDNPALKLPMDQKGARYLYLPNPRELTVNPGLFTANMKILHALGEPWTMSRKCSDVTNWGYFTGEDERCREILQPVVEAAEELGIETLVMTECGHGYKSYLRDAERWLGRPLPFAVRVITGVAEEALAAGRIRVDPAGNPGLHTYHDPCNMSRKTDMADAPRRLLDACVERWVEMTPNREWNWCCGGGGGADQIPETKAVREAFGAAKVDQLRRTGADVVATGCLSCWSTLGSLCKQNEHKVEVRTLGLILARALVFE